MKRQQIRTRRGVSQMTLVRYCEYPPLGKVLTKNAKWYSCERTSIQVNDVGLLILLSAFMAELPLVHWIVCVSSTVNVNVDLWFVCYPLHKQ